MWGYYCLFYSSNCQINNRFWFVGGSTNPTLLIVNNWFPLTQHFRDLKQPRCMIAVKYSRCETLQV